MNSDFSIFPLDNKPNESSTKRYQDDLTAFSQQNPNNDLLNFYSSNFSGFSPMLDSMDFSQSVDNNNFSSKKSSSDFSYSQLPLSSSSSSSSSGKNTNDAFNFAPPLDSDSTPGSSISSLSPHSPSSISLGSSLDSFPKSSSPSFESSPGSFTVREKRKASVAPSNGVNDNKKKSVSTPDSNKPLPKRPGRRIDPNEPENKRKAQNRAAQRAFRERKERHLKELEERVEELENEAQATHTENEFLRKQVDRLRTELRKFRNGKVPATGNQVAPVFPDGKFTFEFPFFQNSKSKGSNDSKVPESTPSDDMSLYSSKSFDNVPTLSQSTPGSSRSSLSCEAEPKEESFCEQLNWACGNRENPIPKYKTPNPLVISSPEMSGPNPSLSDSKPTKSVSNISDVVPPLSFELDFLSDYKDQVLDTAFLNSFSEPSKILSSLDTVSFTLAPTTETDASSSSYLPKSLVDDSDNEAEEDEEDTIPAPTKLMTCTAVWDRISSHPKFAELDIDGLCAELRTKAKCSESGVVLNENDVNQVLSTLS